MERSIEGINTRMLVKERKSLEAHGLGTRIAYATVPPTVEYSLTKKGKKLKPIVDSVYHWSMEFNY